MKKPPCARFGMRISPKASEKPEESRNSRPPKAMLFSVWMIQNCMEPVMFFPLSRLRERVPARSAGGRGRLSAYHTCGPSSGVADWRLLGRPLPSGRGETRRGGGGLQYGSKLFVGGLA